MSSKIKFVIFYLALVASASGLVVLSRTYEPVGVIMSNFWGVYITSQCWTLMIAGLGLTIPISIIAFGFAWLQIYLLATGQITPHLTSEGFGSALKTIFGKLTSPL